MAATDPPVPTADRAEVFAAERPRLVGLAYRMLGSLADAEDVVQEAWLRWQRADREAIERPPAWLTTVVSRLALDRLRVRKREREDYVGPWLPEPLVEGVAPTGSAPMLPEHHAELADSLSTAFLVLLDTLSPTERLVVLLADVFGESFATVAGIVGRSEGATRQLAVRARRKLRRDGPAAAERRPPAEQLRRVEAFVTALLAGDHEALVDLVAPDVVLVTDSGGLVPASRQPLVGRDRIVRFFTKLARHAPPESAFHWAWINGRPGVLITEAGAVTTAIEVELTGPAITALHAHRNPHKLAAIGRTINLR